MAPKRPLSSVSSEPVKINGAALRDEVLADVAASWSACRARHPVLLANLTPTLVVVTAGPTEASAAYLKHKKIAAEKAGFVFRHESFADSSITTAALSASVAAIAASPDVHGIIVQMPLPSHIDGRRVIETIPKEKDVDGLGSVNQGLLQLGLPCMMPCTPQGVVHILQHEKLLAPGKKVAILGRSLLVGRPLATFLSHPGVDCVVTLLHSKVPDATRRAITRDADIVIAATGRHNIIGPDDVSDGVVLIDVGINFIDDPTKKSGRRMVGDINPAAYAKASFYTPVPGGVGPMTVAMLIRNVLLSIQRVKGVEQLPNEWRLQ
jgi:methylenetetrahydrofolate dehydrogenase (NADP+)/methenyltetrahydrofolate cyclohydrolase